MLKNNDYNLGTTEGRWTSFISNTGDRCDKITAGTLNADKVKDSAE